MTNFACGLDLGERMTGMAVADLRTSTTRRVRDFLIPTVHLTDVWDREAKTDKNLKVPSVMLLDPSMQCIAFGDDAYWRWAQLPPSDRKYYYVVDTYKSVLHQLGRSAAAEDLTVDTVDGRKIAARPVFIQLVLYMKRIMKRYMLIRFGILPDDREIYWVVTVPVVWTPAGKAFLRSVLTEAGLAAAPTFCTIVEEPTAALICCRKQRGACATLGPMAVSDYYIVSDLGGFTADFSVHKCTETEDVNTSEDTNEFRHDQVCASRGDRWGSDHFNRAFLTQMCEWFGVDKLFEYRSTRHEDWFFIRDAIEKLKRECSPEFKSDYSILFPMTFVRAMGGDLVVESAIREVNRRLQAEKEEKEEKKEKKEEEEGWTEVPSPSSTSSTLVSSKKPAVIRFCIDTYRLYMAPAFVHGLLDRLITPIVGTIKELVGSLPSGKSVTIYSVGGFSESQLLQAALNAAVTKLGTDRKINFFKPTNPTMAVVEGALIIASRRGRSVYSYVEPHAWGLETLTTVTTKHRADKRPIQTVHPVWNHGQPVEQTLVFWELLSAGSVVPIGQVVRATVYPYNKEAKETSLPIYCTTEVGVCYTDDSKCKQVGRLVITIPPELPFTRSAQAIDLEYCFDTEITVKAALRGRPIPCKLVFK